VLTRYWTVPEKNSLLLPWDFSGYSPGVFLYNRLLWSGVGVAALVAYVEVFPMSVEALTRASQGKRAAQGAPCRTSRKAGAAALP
jgi:ABC-2 type transport system permease protein